MTAPELAYVALVVDEPAATAAIFERNFGLPRREFSSGSRAVPAISVGATAMALFQPGDPFLGPDGRKGVHHVAIAAPDPESAARNSGLATVGDASEGLGGRTQVALARDRTCGVRVRFTEPLDHVPASSAFVERIDHLGVACADNRLARNVFVDRLGCVYESQQIDSEVETISENFTSDTYNYIYYTRPSQLLARMMVTFVTVGDTEFEFLQDLTADVKADEACADEPGTTRGDRSVIARYIAARGAGLHHIAFKTPDIAASLAMLRASGHRMIDTVGRPGSRRSLVGFAHPAAIGGVLMHLVEREEI